ncbi:efflux RND transporter periplasmic adaptor subunit [Cognatazoarcus halotolerans]|uniref:efflux RND transporter periplasmic adaptor subunit n=1 Tax=Cognatazoarcus halotolerans TaxID=2686016 RepID=UPI0013579E8A|nr:HlyD family efflux transporter periplasmic adaptor subunit [Cognatazoarcus halotolerans]MCB1901434.1 HlyD family efflux transporter periplasmic adaptor subunit [Rhodocyclaceae bacterium]MCP5308147.1 HlyD family efflux transporter periplasmic adaptor subunit [Zoogloeaceae bacterium]
MKGSIRALRKLAVLAGLAFGVLAHAHEGHSHGDEPALPAPPAGSAPARLADGSVFLPKPVQRQLGIRTALAEAGAFSTAVELSGKVIADPSVAGMVQAPVDGRIEAGPKGMPLPGTAVTRGQVLAWLVPVIGAAERAGQQSALAELDGALAQAQRDLARLEQLDGSVPHKQIEAARLSVDAISARRSATARGLDGRQALVAPVNGVVAALRAGAGEVVEARATVFEIIDPARLMVEALAYDPALVGTLGDARMQAGGRSVTLAFAGAARSLREQALPVLYRVPAEAAAFVAVGQPVTLTASARQRANGVAVAASAVLRDGGESYVWLHESAERFVRRMVTSVPLDGARLRIAGGLAGGERVVVDGASLLGQVR